MRAPKGKRAREDGVFHERGEADLRTGVKDFHEPAGQDLGNAGAERFAEEGDPAPEHDHFRVEQVHRMGECVCHGCGDLIQNAQRFRVSCGERGS